MAADPVACFAGHLADRPHRARRTRPEHQAHEHPLHGPKGRSTPRHTARRRAALPVGHPLRADDHLRCPGRHRHTPAPRPARRPGRARSAPPGGVAGDVGPDFPCRGSKKQGGPAGRERLLVHPGTHAGDRVPAVLDDLGHVAVSRRACSCAPWPSWRPRRRPVLACSRRSRPGSQLAPGHVDVEVLQLDTPAVTSSSASRLTGSSSAAARSIPCRLLRRLAGAHGDCDQATPSTTSSSTHLHASSLRGHPRVGPLPAADRWSRRPRSAATSPSLGRMDELALETGHHAVERQVLQRSSAPHSIRGGLGVDRTQRHPACVGIRAPHVVERGPDPDLGLDCWYGARLIAFFT